MERTDMELSRRFLYPQPGRQLDELALDKVTMLKLDVEGSELAGLRGARGLLRDGRRPAVIFMESACGRCFVEAMLLFRKVCGVFGSVYSDTMRLEISMDK